MKNNSSNPELSDFEYQQFAELIREISGLELPTVRRPDLEKAVFQTLRGRGLANPQALLALLQEEGAPESDAGTGAENGAGIGANHDLHPALRDIIEAITVGETYFFRNRPQFEALEQIILPQLIETNRPLKRLHIWSAGCATGEEPYSLAILLRRLIPDWSQWNISILATDINRTALANAKRGVYGAWSFRETSPEIQSTYFQAEGRKYQLSPAIRQMVQFNYLNLSNESYPATLVGPQSMDLILCRNVLIYFNEANHRRVIDRLYDCLQETGWLIVGHAEPSAAIYQKFQLHSLPDTIVYQKLSGASSSPRTALAPIAPAFPAPASSAPASSAPAWEPPLRWPSLDRREAVTVQRPAEKASKLVITPAPATAPANASAPASAPAPATASSATKPDTDGEVRAALALYDTGQRDLAIAQLKRLAVDSESAAAALGLARIYANRRELDEARQWVERALARNPLLAQAHYLRGLILLDLGLLEPSMEALRGCLYVDPGFLLGHYSLAGLFRRLAQPQRALKTLQTLEDLLAGRLPDELVTEGDGLTVGRLLEYVALEKERMK